MRVEVLEEDRQGAVRTSARRCLLARALLRTTGLVWDVVPFFGGQKCWTAVREDGARVLRLPDEAAKVANDFDENQPVPLPFAFDLPDS